MKKEEPIEKMIFDAIVEELKTKPELFSFRPHGKKVYKVCYHKNEKVGICKDTGRSLVNDSFKIEYE